MELWFLKPPYVFFVYIQTLLAAVNAKKADGGAWIDMLTSREPEYLHKGESHL